MKTASINLKNHLAQEVTTLATCWKVTLSNDTVLGFTDHAADLVIDGVTFQAAIGYTPSNVTTSNNLAVDNLEVTALIDSSSITEADVLAGLWDYAEVEIFAVNYEDLTQGHLHQRKGHLGNVSIERSQAQAELRGMMQAYTNAIGEVTTPTCRAQFCDARCGLTAASYTVTGSITSITDTRHIADSTLTEDDDYFTYGLITMTSGNNNGLSMEIKGYTQSGGAIELVLPFPYALAVSDTYSMIAGCDKTFDTCIGFSNAINFRGEPHIPGIDKALAYGNGS